MRRLPYLVATMVSCLPPMSVARAEEPGVVDVQPAPSVTAESPGWTPSWLKLGGEIRSRVEAGSTLESAPMDDYYLNRVRVNVAIQPTRWFRFNLQGQDARAFSLRGGDHNEFQNALDVRQAFAEFGAAEAGWNFRVGRQEIAVGDERLIGADNEWDAFGQTFDAVRVGYSGGRIGAYAFAGFRVQPLSRRMDRSDRDNRIAGLSVQVKTWREGVLEPYALWTRAGDSLQGNPGRRNLLTPGVRAQGALPRRFDYNVEMALQRGSVVGDRASSWAGHWELGWRPLEGHAGVRLGAEYNVASGDHDPSDGIHATFDDLYPAGFNRFGTVDPIAWRNIKYPAVGVEVPLSKRLTINGGYRLYSLATVQDGLYLGGAEYAVRNPQATSSFVGSQAIASVTYTWSERWRLGAGYGYLVPGEYLHQAGYHAPLKTAYLQTSFTF